MNQSIRWRLLCASNVAVLVVSPACNNCVPQPILVQEAP